ncbi:MAG: PASTA domain-containing protein [Candidatus Sumerlaeaceae bacterium]|nr:PASTA domain-containing protein [Candidatus Sumerlaeaceae bacterium]
MSRKRKHHRGHDPDASPHATPTVGQSTLDFGEAGPADSSGSAVPGGGHDTVPRMTALSRPPDFESDDTPTTATMRAVRPEETATAGDTLRMPSIKLREPDARGSQPSPEPQMAPDAEESPAQPAARPSGHKGAALRRRILREQMRIARLPRRSSRGRFGFFSWVFGFIGLIFRMFLVTIIVMGLTAVIGYHAVKFYIMTPEVLIPNVRGMKLESAVEILSERGLSVIRERAEPSVLVAPGEIIDQRPPAGSKGKKGGVVRVTVASGRASFIVPDVVGETRENAINKIKGANLEVGDITYIESDRAARDTVINQNPEPNKGLDQAGKVNLLVSSGPPGAGLTMPDLSGRSAEEARQMLARMGITDIVLDPPDATGGRVISQEPLVGKTVSQSQKVVLRIAR